MARRFILWTVCLLVSPLFADKFGDQPNPIERRQNLERLGLHQAQAGEARAASPQPAAKSGTDKVLVILVEFGGPDTFDFTPTGPNKST